MPEWRGLVLKQRAAPLDELVSRMARNSLAKRDHPIVLNHEMGHCPGERHVIMYIIIDNENYTVKKPQLSHVYIKKQVLHLAICFWCYAVAPEI